MKTNVVTIVIAVYNPNPVWLRLQLASIDSQTYPHIEVLALDDCSNSISFDEIFSIFSKCLVKVPFKLFKNQHNAGSNTTFAKLPTWSESPYIAYCDQDDTWHSQKIELLVDNIISTKSVLSYTNFEIINEEGLLISPNAQTYYKRYKMLKGADLAGYLLTKNFIPGCTSLYKTDIAKASLPFVKHMVHDHWLSLNASIRGKIGFVNKPLTSYRIHGENQTGLMKRINKKEDYIRIRVRANKKDSMNFLTDFTHILL